MIIDIYDNKNQLVDTKSKSNLSDISANIFNTVVMNGEKVQEVNFLYYYANYSSTSNTCSVATEWVVSTEWTGTNNNEVYFSGSTT